MKYIWPFTALSGKNVTNRKRKSAIVISYDAWDTGERIGQELLALSDEANVEKLAIAAIMSEKLHRCLRLLPEAEQRIIRDIYFEGKTETETAKALAIPLMTLRYRRDAILRKLRKMLNR